MKTHHHPNRMQIIMPTPTTDPIEHILTVKTPSIIYRLAVGQHVPWQAPKWLFLLITTHRHNNKSYGTI
jgi:hypothetical protein